jgi:hypothetical protein
MAEVTEQIVREAPGIEAYKLGLLESAKAVQMPRLPAYQVAGMTAGQEAAIAAGQQGIGAYQPYMDMATSTQNQALGQMYGASNVAQGAMQGYDPNNAQQFMNPYQQQVIDQAMSNINRQGDIARQNMQGQAVRAGAFGGSREGIQRAELERGLSETRNNSIIQALQQGYGAAQQQAQQAFEQQQGRQMQGAQTMGDLSKGIAGLATQYGNLGAQQQALGQQDVNFGFTLGSQQQKQQQAELDALRASNMQTAMQPYQHLGFLSDIYKGAPSSQMAVSQTSQPAPSPFQQIAGLGTGILSTVGAMKTAGVM